jgi:hypothetical protein
LVEHALMARRQLAVLLVFEADHHVTACPVLEVAEDAPELAKRLQRFVAHAVENPSVVARAAGIAA